MISNTLIRLTPKYVLSLYGSSNELAKTIPEVYLFVKEKGYSPSVINNMNNILELMHHDDINIIINACNKKYVSIKQIYHMNKMICDNTYWHSYSLYLSNVEICEMFNNKDVFNKVYPTKASLDQKKNEMDLYIKKINN